MGWSNQIPFLRWCSNNYSFMDYKPLKLLCSTLVDATNILSYVLPFTYSHWSRKEKSVKARREGVQIKERNSRENIIKQCRWIKRITRTNNSYENFPNPHMIDVRWDLFSSTTTMWFTWKRHQYLYECFSAYPHGWLEGLTRSPIIITKPFYMSPNTTRGICLASGWLSNLVTTFSYATKDIVLITIF